MSELVTIVTYLNAEKSWKSLIFTSYVAPFTMRVSPVTPRGISGGNIDE